MHQMEGLQHLLQPYLHVQDALLTHAVGKEKLHTHAIALELVTAVATELYALGMQQTLHVQLWHTMVQKQEIGDYPQKMNLKHGELIYHLLTQVKVTMA